MLKTICLPLLIVLLIVPVAAADFTIEAGRRIGKIELGVTRAAVHKLLGKPSGTYPISRQVRGDYWQSKTGQTVRVLYQGDSVSQISVTSPSFSTVEKLTTESSLAEVEKSYRQLSKSSYSVRGSGGGLIDYYDAVNEGIAFEFSSPDQPEPSFKLYAIIVHKPGQRAIPEPDEMPLK
jgi:hypothetical protein